MLLGWEGIWGLSVGNSEVEVDGNAEIKSSSVQRKARGGSGFFGGGEKGTE